MTNLPVPLNVLNEHAVAINGEPPQRRTPLPVPNSTRSFWFTSPDVTPTPTEGSEGPLPQDADICIIGSGITGVSAAYHLASGLSKSSAATRDKPLEVVILEAREFCSGATGRNGGHLTAHPFTDFVRLQNEFGTDDALRGLEMEKYTTQEILRILEDNSLGDYVDWVPGGRLMLYFSKDEYDRARADFDAAKAAGVPVDMVQWLTQEQTQERFGALYPAVLIPGNNLWPLKLVAALFNLAKQIGQSASSRPTLSLSLHTLTPVTSISTLSPTEAGLGGKSDQFPRRFSLSTPRGNIKCSYVIHATNAYVSHLLPDLPVIPTRGQIVALRAAVSEEKLTKTAGTGNDGFEYWFPRPVKRDADGEPLENPLVILGGGREATSKLFEFYEVDDGILNPRVGKVLREFLPAVFPGYYEDGREPEMEWSGIMGYTRNGDPFVGPVIDSAGRPVTAQYVSAGYTGHGMPRAFACAQAVADMILADIKGDEWLLPSWLPKHYLTSHGANN